MIEESLNEINTESDHNFFKDNEIVNLKKKLKQLKNDEKFRYFLKLNDLDPVKILSMPNEENKLNSQLMRCSTKESLETFTDSVFENIELRLDDYVMFSYIICRLLECEEKHRLKTEEQYYLILEQQMTRCKTIEEREGELRKKLKSLLSKITPS